MYTWKNGSGEIIADLTSEVKKSIMPDSPGIVAFNIPKNSGLSNQEAQVVDHDGGVHIPNRDCLDGVQRWKHYYLDPSGTYERLSTSLEYSLILYI